jgi:hypothetical protein
MLCIFGLGDCDKDPDLAAVAYYYLLQADSCVTIGDTWCWGAHDWGIDPLDPSNNEMFYDDMVWTWYHPLQAWGFSEDSLKVIMTENWFFEQGEETIYFDQNHPATQLLMHHRGVEQWRQKFYRNGCQHILGPKGIGELYSPVQDMSKPEALWTEIHSHMLVGWEMLMGIEDREQTINGTIGSYSVRIMNNHDGTATFQVYNQTSWRSFLRPPFNLKEEDMKHPIEKAVFAVYEWWTDLTKPRSRSETRGNCICDEGCGGNLDQYYRWVERIPRGVCGCPEWGFFYTRP